MPDWRLVVERPYLPVGTDGSYWIAKLGGLSFGTGKTKKEALRNAHQKLAELGNTVLYELLTTQEET